MIKILIPKMRQSIFKTLSKNTFVFDGIKRGIERETLRTDKNGILSNANYPKQFGSALTNKFITTDFAESSLEFITPVNSNDVTDLVCCVEDIHKYASEKLKNELIWPMSMPCIIPNKVRVAQYGKSNTGLIKTLYRKGLEYRYGAAMQLISGVHYNFSLPNSFWKLWLNALKKSNNHATPSDGYMHLIRNYYRFGWITSYLFGASPAIHRSFTKHKNINIHLNSLNDMLFLPYATSLRLSSIGYNNMSQNSININFNTLEKYAKVLKHATSTPSKKFSNFNKNNHYTQLNCNILQTENELYTFIRPKRSISDSKALSDSLLKHGIEYVEIRSIDINPFSISGINSDQICLLDIFLIWCLLIESPPIYKTEYLNICENWEKVTLNGRKSNLKLKIKNNSIYSIYMSYISQLMFKDFRKIAELLDNGKSEYYRNSCKVWLKTINNPVLTLSGQLLTKIKDNNLLDVAINLSISHKIKLKKRQFQSIEYDTFSKESIRSLSEQKKLETKEML